ncbi:MAG TPA: DNA-directed RNA polymerase subunit alpha [Candidatus Hydrogenedentes bacterium]|nr:DNA-directed RNA polymerase subunit alpha [Candidatus Hydrogenedentota bacterium]HOS02632.1 DNA-directed RNA polymerase subunit alpha [Candidatus Hydrogenedentota bacterium]
MIAKEFVLPRTVRIEEGATGSYARFVVEPFERGYGTTVGNSLRRVLLASLEGAAVTAIRFEGVQHEFSAIPGIKEDVTDIVLNFKQCQLRLNRNEPIIFSFVHKGKGEVTAGDIFRDVDVDVFNPDKVIFTATAATANVEMEIKVAHGRGYVTADHFELEHAPIGTVYLDAGFSPVTKVNFLVEDARVGQMTDYDRLILDVWTNGSLTPQDALQEAAKLLIDHMQIFVRETESSEEAGGSLIGVEDPELMRKLSRSVDELELSVRAANCLKAANIRTIADLVVRQESEMLHFPNFGKKSLDEIKVILETLGLTFGMQVAGVAAPSVSFPTLSSLGEIDDDEIFDDDEEEDEDE